MYYVCNSFDFNQEVEFGQDIHTTFQGKKLVLKDVYAYDGPVTMQYLPYGGIQSVFDYHIILTTKSGFIACDAVEYEGKSLSAKEFIERFPDLVNEVLPS